jgi:TonB-linked SusC/RagA family outer membrane protein
MSLGQSSGTWRVLALTVLGVITSAAAAGAQTATIRGRVTEAASQRPLAEAQVTVSGTTLGSSTNANGEYTITNVPAGNQSLVARRLGYARRIQAVTVPVSGEVRADFAITQAATQLEAVVTTGTGGAVERRTIGNAITQLDVEEITARASVVNVTEVLQGKTPGVTILPGSGAPGTAGEIRIRGSGSISGYRPVVFIDGVRYNIDDLGGFAATGGGTVGVGASPGLGQSAQVTSALNNLNPNDIESIEVIKGPAAATLYGAEAANGVIQIITKKGTRGQQQMRFGLRAERGYNKWPTLPEDNYTTCDAVKQDLSISNNVGLDGKPAWKGCFTWTADSSSWSPIPGNLILRGNPLRDDDAALRTGDLSRLSMNVRGGGERYSFYVAGDRDTEQGVFFNSDNSRTSARSNFGFNPNSASDFQVNVNWQQGRLRLPIQDESANGLLLSARRGRPGFARAPGFNGYSIQSPATANRYRNFTEDERLTVSATANYNPFRWLQNRLTAGFDNTTTQAQVLFLPGEIDATQDPDAAVGANLRRTPTRRLLTLDYAATVRYSPTSTIETSTQFGSQVVADRTETLNARGIGIGAVDVTRIDLLQRSSGGEDFSENNSVGYYIQEQVAWHDRLFLTGAVRADDHSSFGTNFDLIIYPKFSVSYVISDEPSAKGFLDAARITTLKLRSAWGQAGRAPSAYSAPQTYIPDRVILGPTGVGSALRTNTNGYGNPDLKAERGEEIELGFDLGLLNERVGVDFTFYNKKTTDMLQAISVPPSTGFLGTRLDNLGEVTNRGIELSIFGTPVQGPRLSWETRLNVSTNRNRLVAFDIEGLTLQSAGTQPYGTVQQHRPGYPLGGFWVARPLRCGIDEPPAGVTIAPCTGLDGAAMTTAPTVAGTLGNAIFAPDAAREYIGPSTPTREISFSNTVTVFGAVRLYALLDHKGGFYQFNLQERNRCQGADNCARTNNPRARFPQNGADSILWRELAVYRSGTTSPEWIQKADFIKLREVSVTVDVPQRYLRATRAQSASIVLSGRNLAVWSDYEGVDPEVNSYGGRNFVRIDAYASPPTRRLAAAINLTY